MSDEIITGKIREFLADKKWDSITKNAWVNFLYAKLNERERSRLREITSLNSIDGLIETPPNRRKMDDLRFLVGLGTTSDQQAENINTERKAKIAKNLANENAKRREEKKENKRINSMFGKLYISNGNVPTFRNGRKSRKTRKTRKTRKSRKLRR